MAEEEVGPVSSPPAQLDYHKRKHDELEQHEAPEPTPVSEEPVGDLSLESDDVRKDGDDTEVKVSDASDVKRPRLDEKPDVLASENGHELAENENNDIAHGIQDQVKVVAVDEKVDEEGRRDENDKKAFPENAEEIASAADDSKVGNEQPPTTTENEQLGNAEKPVEDEGVKLANEVVREEDTPGERHPDFGSETTSRNIEVPNNKVGVLIGKAGETIRLLQSNSGAKIQITRDAEADPRSSSRPVELVGTTESINKAEKLIRDVIAEADAGGSPSLVARGFTAAVPAGVAEQIQLQVPNEKVGLIIGKGGETIKSLQTQSGARIQLVPQHLPDGDQSKERTVRVSGDKKQIEMARELIKEVMTQPVRPSPVSNNYNQQSYRPRGPAGPAQWLGRGAHQPMSYDYQQRGYPPQNQQYPPPYGGYPSRSTYGSGWEQRPQHGGGYDYYGQGGNMANVSAHSAHGQGHPSGPAMGPPHSQANYNYGQPRPEYGQPAPYTQTAAPHQGYAHGYGESQAPVHQPYGAHVTSQPGSYPVSLQGYPPQQQYNRPPPYGMPPQGPPQSYAPSPASQLGDGSYQAPSQSYGQNVAPQPSYPYTSSAVAPSPYVSAPATNDSYNQSLAASGAVPTYPQQTGQSVPGYSQPVTQQPPAYAQASAAAATYGQYPSSQPVYSEQAAPAGAPTYPYQGQADATYAAGQTYAAASTGQQGYAQQVPAQAGYDQSVAQSGGYAGVVPPAGAVAYGKSLSPQPQPGYAPYDSSQVYGAAR